MKIYTVLITHPYECSSIKGVFPSREEAEGLKKQIIKEDESNGYNEVEIDEWNIPC